MKRSQKIQYIALSVVLAAAIIWFGIRWFTTDNLANNFDEKPNVIDLVFFITVSFVLLHYVVMLVLGWLVTGLITREPDRTGLQVPAVPMRVAVITTYVPNSEPLNLLSATLKGMLLAKDPKGWTHDVWVLDEGDDEAVKRLCRLMGVKYFTRHGIEKYNTKGGIFSVKSKGGNHNAWYDAHGFAEYDIVAQFDTDFQVRPNALLEILPHFSEPSVAWVGTPQIYTNTDHFIAKGAAEQTYGFYGPFMRGLASIDMTMLIGANHTIRVAALKEVGGYDAHLTEDLATGISLHSRGWRSRYVAQPLAHGEGPTTWSAYFKQQHRWAKGCLDLLFTSSVSRVRKMPFFQAAFYLWLQLFYLNGLAFGLGILLLLLNFGFGWQSVGIDFQTFLMGYVPLLVVLELTSLWSQQFNIRPKQERGLYLHARIMMLTVMPVYLWAFVSAIKDRGKHTEFEVTPKGGISIKVTITHEKRAKKKKGQNVFASHIAIATICIVGLFVGIVLGNIDPVNVAWAGFIALAMLVLISNPSWPELKNEFHIQSRRITWETRRAARRVAAHEVRQIAEIKRELKKLSLKSPQTVPVKETV